MAGVEAVKPEEDLLGGPCDGLSVLRTDEPRVYVGEFGGLVLYVYLRGPDGVLRFSHTAKLAPPVPRMFG